MDYDNVRFHLSTPTAKTQILLSLAIQCWPDIQRYGARQHLEAEYGEWLLPEAETEPEYNVSLVIDLEKIPEEGGTYSRCISAQLTRIRRPNGFDLPSVAAEARCSFRSVLAGFRHTGQAADFVRSHQRPLAARASRSGAG